ncbi:ABC transporter ATP-binding protein [Pseudohoeflea coraliihabitans]|uniref:ABC transporter ATP-binding protein/permease n=1 Tax=Pseudohoeflea coraliihabitans TaxID=2860393 RepID=A0ABS6WNY1_9HYPH|nr:ABC transporter ATP-binding protein [Pseudohoeflea sp. DP4N28-3]MBW3097674.1 ABC transporter ATP-binding protein/permease [Pseudohoeflea sp. DP4N28-3]
MKFRVRRNRPVELETLREIIARIMRETGRNYVRQYTIAIISMLVVAATTAFTAWIIEDVVNEAFANKNADVVWMICIAVLLAFLVRGAAAYVQSVTLAAVGNSIVAHYQQRLIDHLVSLNMTWFSTTRSAQIAAQIAQNVGGVRDVMNLTVTSLARDLITLFGLIIVMVIKEPVLSMMSVLIAPPVVLSLRYIAKRLRGATRQAVELNTRVLGAMQESVQGIAIVKAFTMEEQISARTGQLIRAAEERNNRIARLSERTSPLTESIAGIAISGVIAYASFQTIYGDELPGATFAFITALLLAYDPARRLARLQVNLERAAVNARMLYEILDTEPGQADPPGAADLEVEAGGIEFDNVSFAYHDGEKVLDGVSFTVEPGRMTAVVGPSGAGKSTLINLLPRFYDAQEGRILIDGTDITSVTKQSLRKNIAYVSQQPYLFEGTIRDNIRYGRPEVTDAEIEEVARLAQAHDFILAQPNGYDTPLGENGANLSGGQRQRLSIARALVRDAPILLLDEATSSLDNESEALVQQALETAMEGRTVLVIAHRLSTIYRSHMIVVIENGKVVQTGTHEELAARDEGVYARLQKLAGDNAVPGETEREPGAPEKTL